MIKISPSLLAADMCALGQDALRMQQAGADFLHVDCMDGMFVPNFSFGPAVVKRLKEIVNIPLDVHLMVEKPERYIDTYLEMGADFITVHAEATNHLQRALAAIRAGGAKAGVALCPGTSLDAIRYVVPDLDLLLIMTVNPGYGGQKFIPQTMQKIADARRFLDEAGSKALLEMDGGVTENNAAEIRAAGATMLVAGTCLFRSSDPALTMKNLRG